MPTEILMPALSPIMEEGTLARWLVAEGDSVATGDPLAEIETEKATLEFEATGDGTIGRILVGEGTSDVRVGTPIATLLKPGETTLDPGEGAAAGPEAATRTDARGEAAPAGSSETRAPAPPDHARLFASPLARRVAAERGIDLRGLAGSGPQGRIIRADLDRADAPVSDSAHGAECPPPPADTSPDAERPDDEAARGTIAARVSGAPSTVPQVTLRRDIRVDALLSCRTEINRQRGAAVEVIDFVVKACALALQTVPEANATWAEDRLLRVTPSDVAVVVEGATRTPVLHDAEARPLSALSTELAALFACARAGRLSPDGTRGGALAVSDLGMYGVDSFDAIVTPAQSAILAVGAARTAPVVDAEGTCGAATVMSLSLSVDRRVMDSVTGAALLREIAAALEHPVAMLA